MQIRIVVFAAAFLALGSVAHADYGRSEAWFDSLSPEERFFVQFSLMFTDDYVALADGQFGRRTFDALTRFERRNSLPANGVLTPDEHELLRSEAADIYNRVGFAFKDDHRSGLKIGVPEKLLPVVEPTERGTRWRNADSSVELETVRIPGSEVSYSDLYDRLSTHKKTRQIEYETFNDRFFVVSGTNRGKYFYSRYFNMAGDTVGFSLAWNKPHREMLSRLSVAISNTVDLVSAPAENAAAPEASAPEQQPPGGRGTVAGSGTGFFVTAEGHVATNAHVVAGCSELEVAGFGPARVVRSDTTNDLAVLSLRIERPSKPLPLRRGPVRLGEDVVVLGYPLGHIMANSLTVTGGHVNSLNGVGGDSRELQISAPVQPGNSGGPLFDRFGNVVGVVSSRLADAQAQNVNFAIKAPMLDGFLQSASVQPRYSEADGEERSIADIADAGKASTVQVVCRG